MKRTLCILLSVLLMSGCLTMAVFADGEIYENGISEEINILQDELTEEEIRSLYAAEVETYDGIGGQEDYETAALPDETGEEPENPDDPLNPEDPDDPWYPEDPDEPEEPENTDYYARMSIISNWNSVVPHVFFYVENLTGHDIAVGAYSCPAGQSVSVGSFGMSVSDGAGIYYNLEKYRNEYKGEYRGIRCLSQVISKSDLENVTKFILNNNVFDPIVRNCSWFATGCWNAGGGDRLPRVVVLPWIMRALMTARGADGYANLSHVERDQVMRQVGRGSSATVRVVSDGSL